MTGSHLIIEPESTQIPPTGDTYPPHLHLRPHPVIAWIAVSVAIVLNIVVFFLTFRTMGTGIAGMSAMVVPITAAWFFGVWGGAVGAIGVALLHAGLVFLTTPDQLVVWLGRAHTILGHLAILLVAVLIGRIRDFGWRLRREILRRERFEEELQKARQVAERASAAKSAFLSQISHEIRTPMGGMIGLIDLLRTSELSVDQRSQVESIRDNSLALLTLIDDLLDLSKAEAGKLTISTAPFCPRQLVRDVAVLFSGRATTKRLEFEIDVDARVPERLEGDALRLRQVLYNLVGNAFKFTDQGSVRVAMRVMRLEAAAVALRFEVKDTGLGITPDQRVRLFEPYAQASDETQRVYGGSGLGLSICRDIVQRMGGRIGVDSVPGLGSEFWFEVELPIMAREEPLPDRGAAAPLSATEPPSSRRVLLVEDNDTNRQIFAQMLTALGYRVDTARHGEEALSFLSETRVDVVLMDVEMPVLDGISAARQIRNPASRVLDHEVPIIALTAHARTVDLTRCHEAGMNGEIVKPFTLQSLSQTLSRHLSPAPVRPPSASVLGESEPAEAADR